MTQRHQNALNLRGKLSQLPRHSEPPGVPSDSFDSEDSDSFCTHHPAIGDATIFDRFIRLMEKR